MILKLKAKHFKNTNFCLGMCAIEKAYMESTGNKCVEGVNKLFDTTTNTLYKHKRYGLFKFAFDKIISKFLFNNIVVRTIKLEKI